MNDVNDGGPAFPHVSRVDSRGNGIYEQQVFADGGMSLRDYFAAQAIGGMTVTSDRHDWKYHAEAAYCFADAMLAERAK